MNSAGRSTGDAFAYALLFMAASDDRIVSVEGGDAAWSSPFTESYPERCFNAGAAEQNLILTAAGLALGGDNVFVSSYAAFLTGKGYDQIRTAVAIPSIPVRIAGFGAGLTAGEEGACRQMLEDIALMRVFPGMNVLVPADYTAAFALLKSAAVLQKPSYIRLGAAATPDIYEEGDEAFFPGGGRVLREGTGVTICCCGIMVPEALRAADVLARQNISAEVIDCYSVSPLPVQAILDSVHRTGCCVTAEEHFAIGGLGEAVASLTGANYPVPVKMVAVFDKFGQSGSPPELKEYYGLTASQIVSAAMQAWIMRRR